MNETVSAAAVLFRHGEAAEPRPRHADRGTPKSSRSLRAVQLNPVRSSASVTHIAGDSMVALELKKVRTP